MEKQIFENRMRWLEQMRNAPKTTGKLTKVQFLPNNIRQEADCCLGAACKALNVPRLEQSPNMFYYETCSLTLPEQAQKMLNMRFLGDLTNDGASAAQRFTKIDNKGYDALVCYNDRVYKTDETLDNMRSLIQWLLCLEYLFGIECFEKPSL